MKILLNAIALLLVAASTPSFADYGNSPKCKHIQAKISKSRELVEFAKHNMRPDQAANAMINSNKRIAKLKQQYHDIGCDGSMPRVRETPTYTQVTPAPSAMPGNNTTMQQPPDSRAVCVTQCKQYTSRSDEECFDACWK